MPNICQCRMAQWLRWLYDKPVVKTSVDLMPEDIDATHWPLNHRPFLFETILPQVFAVGEVRSSRVKCVASAVGEGAVAKQLVHLTLSEYKQEPRPSASQPN